MMSALSHSHKTNTEPEKHTRLEEANTSLRQRYEWRRIKTLFMAHYQGLYGKITQPSDKLVVIDSESETSAPAAAGVGRREALLALKMAHSEKIWAYWSDHTSIGCGGLSENLAVHLHIRRFMAAFVSAFFKSAACQLLCGISELFSFIYTSWSCVLSFQKGLPHSTLYCSQSITSTWLREAPRCVLMRTSGCETACAHNGLWLTRPLCVQFAENFYDFNYSQVTEGFKEIVYR